jgi:hypothetical protein
MKSKFTTLFFLIIAISFLDSLQGNNLIIANSSSTIKGSIEEDAFSIVAYLASFIKTEEQYLEKNKIEPKIKCKNCSTKQLGMSEFGGSIIGIALKDTVDGKKNFEQTKPLLDGFLKVISEGSFLEILNYMVCVSNEIWQVCSHCHHDGHGDSWEKIG